MTDPFDALREPVVPLAPRPEFARDLRRRIAAELAPDTDPEENTVPVLAVREYTPARLHSLTPYLATSDPARAIQWYIDVFDAVLLGDPIVMPDGRIGHAELRVGDTVFMLAGEFPEEGHMSPETLGGSTVGLMLHVPDSEATYARAVDMGATALRPIAESYGARRRNDPRPVRSPLVRADRDRGRRHSCRGRVRPALRRHRLSHAPGCRRRTRGALLRQPLRLAARARLPTRRIPHFVDHSAGRHRQPPGEPGSAAVLPRRRHRGGRGRVRELGGEVLSIGDYESGGNAECVDDQGLRFDLFRPKPGY